jgi:von Willebrand factor type A domain
MTQKGTEIPTVRNRRRPIMRGLLLVLGLFLLGAPAVSAAVPNPGWPGKCPLRLVIVVDLSTSMDPNLPQVKQSTRDLIDALRGAPNQVAVVAFGAAAAVAIPMGDVSDEDNRARMKDSVDTIALLPGDGGGTNWEFALTTAATLDPDVVVLLTDGQPTAHGDPYSQAGLADDANNVSAAVTVADEMRTEGVRVVGLGIGLTDEFTANLAEVSGPISGDDYYQTGSDADGLLSRLYDIASKACGLPVAALPQPEGANIPIAAIVGAVVGAMLLAILVGYLLSRRKSVTVATTLKSVKLADPTIKRPASPKVPNLSSRTIDRSATSDRSSDTQPNGPPRAPRARDLSWLHESDPPSQRGADDL